jgi:hypothetical protein
MKRISKCRSVVYSLTLIVALLVITTGVGNSAAPTQNVNVVNTPSVGIAGTPTVQVGNTPTSPVPVGNVNDARNPFQRRVAFDIVGTTQGDAGIIVPAGKRLVIEHISARAQGPVGVKYFGSIQVVAWPGEQQAIHYLVFNFQGTFGDVDEYTASQPLRAYADVNVPPATFTVTRSDITGSSHIEMDISGYLVDVP